MPKLSESSFPVLIKATGMKKGELANILGINPQTISEWKEAAPKYATAYLQLKLDMMAQANELRKARQVVEDYVDLKIKTKELSGLAAELVLKAAEENPLKKRKQ